MSSERRYDPHLIEPKWQQIWARERTWEVSNEPGPDSGGHGDGSGAARNGPDARQKSYVLEMLPYPSGEPHIGHLKNYSLGDAIAHFHRRTGHRVLHPMGYDAFGLPAENYAIKTGVHPRKSTDESIAAFQRAFRSWGISIDWSRELATHEPSYYRWTQWIFLKLFERGLAYRKEAAVNWCPFDQTVLANEQVIDGRCERCGHLVEVRIHPGIVEMLLHLIDRRRDQPRRERPLDRANIIDLAHVGAYDMRPASQSFDRALHVQKFFARAAHQNNFRSGARIGRSKGATDAGARARDDGQAAIEAERR